MRETAQRPTAFSRYWRPGAGNAAAPVEPDPTWLTMGYYRPVHPGLVCSKANSVGLPGGFNEMHTSDGVLLDLDGKIDKADGTKLKICKPQIGGPTPLFGLFDSENSQSSSRSARTKSIRLRISWLERLAKTKPDPRKSEK
jgi:hypothetical protein